ncbi:MAG TPA: ATP-binding protein [Bacteroidota bacterium]|nr:ATP-binding protein [Bacteroidota bacterium]
MAAEYRTKPARKTFRFTMSSNPKNIHRVEQFLLKINSSLKFSDERFGTLLVIVTEAVNNAIIHGNKRNAAKKVVVTGTVAGHLLTIRVKDEGKGFDPHRVPNPIDEGNLLRDSGRGVFLMRQLAEKVHYNTSGNEVTLTIKF